MDTNEKVWKCPECGEEFRESDSKFSSRNLYRKDGEYITPTHDFPKPCRSVCRGAGQLLQKKD